MNLKTQIKAPQVTSYLDNMLKKLSSRLYT